jgi:hypothetical protein
VPEELRLKRVELNRAQTRVHNFVDQSARELVWDLRVLCVGALGAGLGAPLTC